MNTLTPIRQAATDTALTQARWRQRVELAAAYRAVDHFGWTEQIYAHLTARVPGSDDRFLITTWFSLPLVMCSAEWMMKPA